jgi:MoaA/NifB/PqqE/SkfB family radical SAM enzyme
LADVAHSVGAKVEINLLSRSLFFPQNADINSMWPDEENALLIESFLRDIAKQPGYGVKYVRDHYKGSVEEPACVLGYLQVFVLSNGDVLTGCYPLPPVGNILKNSLREVVESQA